MVVRKRFGQHFLHDPAVIERIEGSEDCPAQIAIEPELVVRESSGPVVNSRRLVALASD